jgi:uncharacterized membrane protein
MTTEKIIRLMAGTFVLTGTALAFLTGHAAWLLVPAFVGTNLVQSVFTGFCPAENIVRALGARDGCPQGR